MEDDINRGWVLVAIGGVCLLSSLLTIRSGRVLQSWTTSYGWTSYYYLHRDEAPCLFAILMLIQLLVSFGILFFGVRELVG